MVPHDARIEFVKNLSIHAGIIKLSRLIMLIAKKEMSPFVSTVHHQFPSLLQGEHLGQVIF